MYLTEPRLRPYDLNFRLGGVPVRITPWFWVVHGGIGLVFAAMRWVIYEDIDLFFATISGVAFLFFWVGAVLLSLLVHEFGHVLAGKVFGSSGRIVLTPFFGLALDCADLYEPRKRLLVYAAGPAAQLLLAAVLWPVYANLDWPKFTELSVSSSEEEVMEAVADLSGAETRLLYLSMLAILLEMNVVWPLLNLLPIPPLDGWHIYREWKQGRYGGHAPWEQDPDWWKRG